MTTSTLSNPLVGLGRPSCRKREYRTEKEATKALRKARGSRTTYGDRLPTRVYWHDACGCWHLTSMA